MPTEPPIYRITVRPPDIVARIEFLPTSLGGRQGPARSGYRPSHNFGLDTLNDAVHEYIGQDWAAPGQTVLANIWLLVPEYQQGRLFAGLAFTVQEGSRVVGHAVVQDVLNEYLRKGNA